jgi:CheY-like chemotaxis protein
MPRARILLVDDDEALARAFRDDLQLEHDVRVVTSGREALDVLLAGERFDLILCDLMMRSMSGMALYHELRSRSPGLEQQLLFMTGGAFTPRAREFLASVSNPCFEKPFEVRPIIEAVMRDRRR